MRSLLLLLLLFVLATGPFPSAQAQPKVDSLKALLRADREDTVKVNHLIDLAWRLSRSSPDTSIVLANEAMIISQKAGSKKHIANCYHQIGWANFVMGNYPVSLENNFKALHLKEELKDSTGIAKSYGNLGLIYTEQRDYEKALSYYQASLRIKERMNDHKGIAKSLVNIGMVYHSQGQYEKALPYYFRALKSFEENGDRNATAINLGNIGTAYFELNDPTQAVHYFNKALKIGQELEDKFIQSSNLGNLGALYLKSGKFAESETCLRKALSLSYEVGDKESIKEWNQKLAALYDTTGRFELAYRHFKLASFYKDSLANEENTKKQTQAEMLYEFGKKEALAKAEQEKKDAAAAAEKQRQNILTYSVSAGFVLLLFLALFIYRSYRQKKKANQELAEKNSIIERSKHIIEEKNKDITDSINYAKRIQKAMLPHRRDIWASFPQSFVLFKPKDIVSGDFYFFHAQGNSSFIAVADCTGHGVPGAFMSMIGSNKLDEAVRASSDPSEILSRLNKGVKAALKQSEEDARSTRDGMDIAVCCVDPATRTVRYAGANRPIWIIRKNASEVEEIRATKKAIGGFTEDDQQFDTHTIRFNEGDSFYLSTDGYGDTFGKGGKKLMTKRFKELLLGIQDRSMKEQEKHLLNFVEEWMDGAEQVDDILVVGIRL